MAYNKKTWESDEVITQEALNNMEDGIAAAHASIAATNTNLAGKQDALTPGSGITITDNTISIDAAHASEPESTDQAKLASVGKVKELIDEGGNVTPSPALDPTNDMQIPSSKAVADYITPRSILYEEIKSANLHNSAPAVTSDTEPDGPDWKDHYINEDNGIVHLSPNNPYNITYYMEVEGGKSYKSNHSALSIAWFDENKAYISWVRISGLIPAETKFVAPTNAKYVRMSYYDQNPNPDSVKFGLYDDDINVSYGAKVIKTIEGDNIAIEPRKIITVIGSSGFSPLSGGQFMLSAAKQALYDVSTDLTVVRVMQKMLGYDVANNMAYGGNTPSSIFFKGGLASYVTKVDVTLPADGSYVDFAFNQTNLGFQMTSNPNDESVKEKFEDLYGSKGFAATINGYDVDIVVPYSQTDSNKSKIKLHFQQTTDVLIKSDSLIYKKPDVGSLGNGMVVKQIGGTTGLICQIGANSEGCTADEIIAYIDLAIARSGCKWFIVLKQNIASASSDLNNAEDKIKAKYGSNYVDHLSYMSSLKALEDMGVTPTTDETYTDADGNNSNPLTATQIANNVPSDIKCIAEGRVPSSFWHSAYRDGFAADGTTPEVQEINEGHFNAIGLECLGLYLAKYAKQILGA